MQVFIVFLFSMIIVSINCIPLHARTNLSAPRASVVIGKQCEVLSPKVLIISMVRFYANESLDEFLHLVNLYSFLQRHQSGIKMPIRLDQ